MEYGSDYNYTFLIVFVKIVSFESLEVNNSICYKQGFISDSFVPGPYLRLTSLESTVLMMSWMKALGLIFGWQDQT